MKISEEVLGLSVIIFTVICLTLLAVIRMFIYSKPAGRRMVGTVIEFCTSMDIRLSIVWDSKSIQASLEPLSPAKGTYIHAPAHTCTTHLI